MSKINDLIKELCPNGVEYKQLREISNMQRGQSITSKDLITGTVPVVAGGQEPSFYNDKFNRIGETITVSSSGAYAGHINYWNEPILCTDSFSIKSDTINIKYLYHYLKLKQKYIYEKKKGAGIPHVHISDIEKLLIPVPPKEVQEEIVKILDKFGELEAELEAELVSRKQQYEFWRRKLLDKENYKSYKRYNITEVCKDIFAGGDVPKDTIKGILKPQDDFIYPVISNGVGENAIYGYSKNYKVNVSSCVTIAARGTIGYHEVRYGKFTPIIRLITLIPNTEIITTKFLNYALYNYSFNSSGGIPQLTTPTIKKFDLNVPPIEEQERIVNILDKFDKLINESIPKEIKLRRKQYEYYRNKLLSFEELKEND